MKAKITLLMALASLNFMVATVLTGCGGGKSKALDVSPQIEALKGNDASKKTDALAALAQMGSGAAPAVPALIEVLKDPDPLNRRLAASALGGIGKPAASAIPSLKELMKEGDIMMAQSALNAIRSIDPKSVDPDMQIKNVSNPTE